jgi:hypothetical protein
MQAWEYKWLNVVYTPPFNGVAGDNYELVTEDYTVIPELSRRKKTDVMEYINALGREGWELLSSQHVQTLETSTSRIEFHLCFKRSNGKV